MRELRQHASRYVAMAKAGMRVPVTDQGELVAYLVPADQPRYDLRAHGGRRAGPTGDGRVPSGSPAPSACAAG